jgi:hypothetical protein
MNLYLLRLRSFDPNASNHTNAGSHRKRHWFVLILLLALELTTRIIKVQSKFSLNAYTRYIAAERRAKYPDMFVMKTVYERAIAEAAKRRFNEESGAEEALRLFWVGYCDVLVRFTYSDAVITSSLTSAFRCKRINGAGATIEHDILQRAVRSVPASGEIWARYLRYLVSLWLIRGFSYVNLFPLTRNGLLTLTMWQRPERALQARYCPAQLTCLPRSR